MADQEQLVSDCIAVYQSRNIANLQPLFSTNFKYETLPKAPGLPDETRQGYINKFSPIFSKFTNVEIQTQQLVNAPGKVVLHFSGTGTVANPTAHIAYESLVVLTIVTEGGSLKISEIKSFSPNPQKRADFYAWAARALV